MSLSRHIVKIAGMFILGALWVNANAWALDIDFSDVTSNNEENEDSWGSIFNDLEQEKAEKKQRKKDRALAKIKAKCEDSDDIRGCVEDKGFPFLILRSTDSRPSYICNRRLSNPSDNERRQCLKLVEEEQKRDRNAYYERKAKAREECEERKRYCEQLMESVSKGELPSEKVDNIPAVNEEAMSQASSTLDRALESRLNSKLEALEEKGRQRSRQEEAEKIEREAEIARKKEEQERKRRAAEERKKRECLKQKNARTCDCLKYFPRPENSKKGTLTCGV